MKIYLQQDGASAGPFDVSTVRERLEQGSLAPDVYAWREGMGEWRPLHEVLPVVPLTTPAPLAPPPASLPFPSTQTPGTPVAARMPWWGKVLVGCGGLIALAMLVLAGVIVYAIRLDNANHRAGSSNMAFQHYENGTRPDSGDADLDKMNRDMAAQEAKEKKEQDEIEAEIQRAGTDLDHYTVTTQTASNGGKTTTITPKNGGAGKPVTRTVDPDGKVTTAYDDDEGNTVTRSLDRDHNVTTSIQPKVGQATPAR